MLVIHGIARIAAGGVTPFGGFLSAQGLPFGTAVAWLISIMEVAGGLTLAAGRFVVPLAIWFSVELTTGIILVHAPDGWFVVGLGRNGMEYSVLLIECLLITALLAPAARQKTA